MKLKLKIIVFIVCFLSIHNIEATEIIRDQEIESFFQKIIDPMQNQTTKAKNIKVFLIHSNEINAFTDGLQTIYVYTGLLRKLTDVCELIGILGHEMAHIEAGHHVLRTEKFKNLNKASLAVMLLGSLGTIMGGKNGFEAGMAATAGGMSIVNAQFLHFSQEQESVADNLGVKILNNANYNPHFLIEGLKKIMSLDFHTTHKRMKYFQTHPPLENRLSSLQAEITHLKNNHEKQDLFLHQLRQDSQRILAKLDGFFEKEVFIEQKYQNQPELKDYSQIVYLQKERKFDEAETIIQKLQKKWPTDNFLLELEAQNLYEQRKIEQSIQIYQKIIPNFKQNSLINLEFLNVLTDSENPDNLQNSLKQLKNILQKDKKNYIAWHILAKASTKMQNQCSTYFALGRMHQAVGNLRMSKKYAQMLSEVKNTCSAEDLQIVEQLK